jgi:hypothetical protein
MAYSPKASGLGNTAAYQVSGRPYLTGSVVENGNGATPAASQFKITFPYVTRTVRIVNTGSASLRIHFADITASPALHNEHNYMVIPPDGNHYASGTLDNFISGSYKNRPLELNMKCRDLYVSSVNEGQSGFQVIAELTHIPSGDMYVLSGSGLNGNGS